ncbi:MAG: hypothetical protein EOQ39_29550 [Mesorhizobium sp.]|uniref:aldolase/citrate lyase family protein n=1 Tax=Mesorhizobium sp. TaxID=1871066 RepID=UPI000FE94009|nr:MAG: hypothetical protein EOQ37_32835 [Mesorhizobium sp.]RWB10989.1 MAG: hypothetical protein EOQ39_29550 [Mesorhizobium sp.]
MIVRVNRDLANCVADLYVGVTKGACAVMLPKVSGPDHSTLVADSMAELERRAGLAAESIGLIPLIETPAALADLAPTSTASARTIALAFGGEDFSTGCGFAPTFQNLFDPCQQLVLGARTARLRAFRPTRQHRGLRR